MNDEIPTLRMEVDYSTERKVELMQDELEQYVTERVERDPDFGAALAHAERRAQLIDIAQEVIGEWVDTACKIATATWGSDESAQEAIRQIRHLHLAEPWHPASKLAQRFMA